jgi:hypothetical protein
MGHRPGLDAVHAGLKALQAAEGERFAPAPALVEAAATRRQRRRYAFGALPRSR